MATKVAAKNINITYNSVAIEDDVESSTLDINVETPVVTSFADAGPRRVEGNYDYSLELGITPDFAASQSDATLFGRIGNGGAALGFDPTGASAATNDPNYDSSSMLLSKYTISGAVGGAVKGSATLVGNSALARNVA